ncbi:MAG: hypothetical protein QY314_02295 [Candidatus Dojkabacteria bacterium]|nr:MAG: hypothetical protein QY314_02295 [Candidatus Dojkabacteria bacterium]
MDETTKTTEATVVATSDSNTKLIAAVAWLLAPISSIVLIVLDNYKKDKFIQFHAWQSLAFGIVAFIANAVLSWTCIVPLAVFVVWILGVIKAFQGEMWKLPVIGDWAEQQVESASKK